MRMDQEYLSETRKELAASTLEFIERQIKQTLLECWNHRSDGIRSVEEQQNVKRQAENYVQASKQNKKHRFRSCKVRMEGE